MPTTPRGVPRNGRTSTKHYKEHIISTLLYNKGINRKSFRTRLHIKSPQYYDKCMREPGKLLTIDQIEVIAGVLEIPFFECIALIRGASTTKAGKWYEAQQPPA